MRKGDGKMKIRKKIILFSLLGVLSIGSIIGFTSNSLIKANDSDVAAPTAMLDETVGQTVQKEVKDEYPRDPNGDILPSYAVSGEVDVTQYSGNQVMDIASDADFKAALLDKNVVVFNIVADFKFSRNGTYSSGAANWNPTTGNRTIVVEGNNHTLDFQNTSFWLAYGTWNVTIQNLNAYFENYYGFMTTNNNSNEKNSLVTYHNLETHGSQLVCAKLTPTRFSGKVSTELIPSYTSPIDGATQTTQYSGQQNMEVGATTVLAGADVTIIAGPVGSLELSGQMEVEPNAKISIDNNAAPTNTTGELAQTVRISSGGLHLQEQAYMEINTKRTYSALAISATGAFVTIDRKAQLDIVSTGNASGDGANYNTIYLSTGAKLSVGAEGILNVNDTGKATGTGSTIYAGNGAVFTVAKKGIFSVKADGTGSKSLIRMGSSSQFQFSDAQQVDMSFQGTPAVASSLIEIAGSAGYFDVDVQRVKQWNRGNETGTPDKDWTPMFGMRIPYSSRVVTNSGIIARSTTAATRSDFINYYNSGATKGTVPGAQRLLFEYIPDVTVSIDSIANDLITDVGSNTVNGVTNPEAYVRITYTPPTGGKPITIEQNVASPVEATSGEALDEQTSPFTVQAPSVANANGATYSYTLPNGQRFEAGGIINVYSFKEGKSDVATQVVLDKTPPAGDSVDFHAVVNDAVPGAERFVKNPTDTNPVTPTFGYEYAEENSAADIAEMLKKQGEYDIYVYLLDNAVDADGNPAPNKTKIKSKLIVHDTSVAIDGSDITFKTSEINSLTNDQLSQLVLTNSNATASNIVDGTAIDMTGKLQISDMGGLTPTATEGFYTVTLTVKAADSGLATDVTKTIQVFVSDDSTAISKDGKYALKGNDFSVAAKDYPTTEAALTEMIQKESGAILWQLQPSPGQTLPVTDIQIDKGSLPGPITAGNVATAGNYTVILSYGTGDSLVQKTITVTVVKSLASVTVEFVDENGKAIDNPIVFEGTIGQTVDLTTNQAVIDTIAAIEAKHYVIDQRPTDEAAVEVLTDGTTVQYKFKGTLSIYSAPTEINFGTEKAGIFGVRVDKPTYDKDLVIWDNRASLTTWSLTAKLDTYLTSKTDATKVLPDALKYQTGADQASEITLTNGAQEIVSAQHTAAGQYNVSADWANGNKGFKLDVPAGQIRQLGDYEAVIIWAVGVTP